MESRKLGNKTKIIKLMSNVGNYGLIILTIQWDSKCTFCFPLLHEYFLEWSKQILLVCLGFPVEWKEHSPIHSLCRSYTCICGHAVWKHKCLWARFPDTSFEPFHELSLFTVQWRDTFSHLSNSSFIQSGSNHLQCTTHK